MPDWLTNLLPAIAGLAGVVLGVWMTQRGAETLSKQALDGQRMLADDAALREWRRQQVAPFLEAANQRVHFWAEFLSVAALNDMVRRGEKKSEDIPEQYRIGPVIERLVDPAFNILTLTISGNPDPAFREAFLAFEHAQTSKKADYTAHEVIEVIAALKKPYAALNEAVERYIFSRPPSDKS